MENSYLCGNCKTKIALQCQSVDEVPKVFPKSLLSIIDNDSKLRISEETVNESTENAAAAELSAFKIEGILCLQCSKPLGFKFVEKVSTDEIGIGSAAQGGGSDGGKVSTGEEEIRGQPAGFLYKPTDDANALGSHDVRYLEIQDGLDILETLTSYAQGQQRVVLVLRATGMVQNVILLTHNSAASSDQGLEGTFRILCLSGLFIPVELAAPPAPESVVTVCLAGAGPGGHESDRLVGGTIAAGPLVASGPVVVTALLFANATYERLGDEERPAGPAGTGEEDSLPSHEIYEASLNAPLPIEEEQEAPEDNQIIANVV